MKRSMLIAGVLALAVTAGGGAVLAGSANAATVVEKIAGHFGKTPIRAVLDNADVAAALGLSEDELRTERQAGKSLAAIAGEQGVAVQTVVDIVTKAMTAALDRQLADGKLTQAEYDTRKAELAERAAELVNGTFAGGIGKGGPGGPGGRGGSLGGVDNADVAAALGLSEDELRTERQAGKSLAAIAGEQGVAVQTVVDVVTKAMTAALDRQLADGKLTQAEYDTRKAELAERAAGLVNGTFAGGIGKGGPSGPGGRGGFPGGGRFHGKGGQDGAVPESGTSPEAAANA